MPRRQKEIEMSAYELYRGYRFEVCGEQIEVSDVHADRSGKKCVFVEETRKNGQEDCHMSGELILCDDKWSWDEGGRDSFDTYGSPKLSQAIVDFLNANPHPGLFRREPPTLSFEEAAELEKEDIA